MNGGLVAGVAPEAQEMESEPCPGKAGRSGDLCNTRVIKVMSPSSEEGLWAWGQLLSSLLGPELLRGPGWSRGGAALSSLDSVTLATLPHEFPVGPWAPSLALPQEEVLFLCVHVHMKV